MGKFTFGFGLGFCAGAVAVPAAVIVALDNSDPIAKALHRLGNAFENVDLTDSEDELGTVATSADIAHQPEKLESAPAGESPFEVPSPGIPPAA